MAGSVVAEAVAPGQVDTDIGRTERLIDVLVAAEQRNVAEFGALVHALEGEIRGDDPVAHIQRGLDDMAADVPGGAGHKDGFHCSDLSSWLGR